MYGKRGPFVQTVWEHMAQCELLLITSSPSKLERWNLDHLIPHSLSNLIHTIFMVMGRYSIV